MKPEGWDRIKELFSSALEREPNHRSSFLREACGEDEALRSEVESLLSSYSQANSFIERQAAESTADTSEETLTGQRIGSYQVIREIGRGGMAVVYLAVRADDQYRKRVAIKLLKKGMDLDEISRRFRNERQTLAALDHPNIVRLLDGGSTEEGLPYLVMDYVEGVSITAYSDSHRLPISQRLELFRVVCGAVHYAHQNLVIHRDLKPGNILVTAEGAPKLLDFGIAKLLNPEFSAQTLLATQADHRLMTPEYASPEQVRGQPVTTATDVYSLGVLLYELLTGHRPYQLDDRSLCEIERVICEVEPEKPSTAVTRAAKVSSLEGTTQTDLTPEFVSQTREGRPEKLRQRLRGDLDNIVLMALRKEPQGRYASAEQFSQDIRRHLEDLPVTARPATPGYRVSKFVHRHAVGVIAAAGVLLILLVGIVVTAREAKIARVEKSRAERRFNDVRQLANSFLFEFHDSIKDLPGATPARKLVVQKAVEYLDRLAKEAGGDASLQAELAEAYLRVGDVQGNPYKANLGDHPGALESYGKALAIAQKLREDSPKKATGRYLAARSQILIGQVLTHNGEAAAAIDSFRKGIAIFEALVAEQPTETKLQLELADSYGSLGDALDSPAVLNVNDKAGAFENFQKSLAIYQHLATAEPKNPRILSGLANAETQIGDSREDSGAVAQALNSFNDAFKIYEDLSAMDPNNPRYRKNLTSILDRMAMLRAEAGDKAGAVRDMQKSLEIYDALAVADPQNMNLREGLWLRHIHLGETLPKTGDKSGALQNFRKALAIIQDLALRSPGNLQIQAKLADTFWEFGLFQAKTADKTEGKEMVSRGLRIFKVLAEKPDATAWELNRYAEAMLNCEPGGPCNATATLPYAKRAVEMTNASDPGLLDSLATAYFKIGDSRKAVEIEQKAVDLLSSSDSGKAASAKGKQYEDNLAKFKKALR